MSQVTLIMIFRRRWLVATLLVVAAMAGMARLGIWQLDRLEQRQAFNERVLAQIDQAPFELNDRNMNEDLSRMEYRDVVVRGRFDFLQEMVLRNQAWNGLYGVHLLTPLLIEGTEQIVLVDRGWIPAEDFEEGRLTQFQEFGMVEVRGVFRRSMERADFGLMTDEAPVTGEWRMAWNLVNLELMSQQTSVTLLSAYIQQSPDSNWTGMPYRSQPDLEISEGPHMRYAIQWFTFAGILGTGYPVFVSWEEKKTLRKSDRGGIDGSGTVG